MESVGSTYYASDMEAAQESVKNTQQLYQNILKELESSGQSDTARGIRESWSLKMEQLQAELDQALHAGGD